MEKMLWQTCRGVEFRERTPELRATLAQSFARLRAKTGAGGRTIDSVTSRWVDGKRWTGAVWRRLLRECGKEWRVSRRGLRTPRQEALKDNSTTSTPIPKVSPAAPINEAQTGWPRARHDLRFVPRSSSNSSEAGLIPGGCFVHEPPCNRDG